MRLLQEENVWIVGTAGKPTIRCSRANDRPDGAGDGRGRRRHASSDREHCDELISIPMAGSVSSLNVSVATGICLFEAVRQRS